VNNLLQLKGQFHIKGAGRPGSPQLPKNGEVSAKHLLDLRQQLVEIKDYWRKKQIPFNPLISVYYKKITAKSNRIRRLLGGGSSRASNSIVGARFEGYLDNTHHVITYCVSETIVDDSIDVLESCAAIVDKYGGSIDYEILEQIKKTFKKKKWPYEPSKSIFLQVIRDAYFAERFGIRTQQEVVDGWVVVNLYDTGYSDVRDFLNGLGLRVTPDQVLGNALRLSPDQYSVLIGKYPFLVSMAISDISKLTPEEFDEVGINPLDIPKAGNEPIIGVIDTPFDENVYFSDWVEPINLIPPEIEIHPEDCAHGTKVTSLIVDGPILVPDLDDGCGRFRVRHFGVATGSRSDSFAFMRRVKSIVEQNRDIKVWNISQGSVREVARNFVSPEGAILDELQSRFDDVVFVVAGTNQTHEKQQKIGAPADSINSLVVNATSFSGETASYSRSGPVLEFFKKPDVCAVGGDQDVPMYTYAGNGGSWVQGTSFAAPWIARKMAYLMQIMGFNREVAKALIIDAAARWKYREDSKRGYGQVPIRIEDVVQCKDDEIKFVLTGIADSYETYNVDIPVPVVNSKHPYIARATLCYFPPCDRRQGVDYTSTELDLHFGRIDDKGSLIALNNNRQGENDDYTTEATARNSYRKWDNVKHIGEVFRRGQRGRKAYGTQMWGLKIRKTSRWDNPASAPFGNLRFGIVVTLREMDGVNRIDEFIQKCSLRGWIVNKVDIQNRLDIYNAAEVEIDFKE